MLLLRPIDVVHCIHNAFRLDMSQIDAGVLNLAKGGGDLTPWFSRLQVIGEILDYHAQGEEAAVFPAAKNLAPFMVDPYIFDHRELDHMVEGLDTLKKAPDPLTAARATAVLQSHLRIHLNKEDIYLYPFIREQTTNEQQIAIGREMSSKIPPHKFPTTIQWLFPLLNLTDQVTVTSIWMQIMPPEVFAKVKPLIKQNTAQTWEKLIQQIPELSST